MHPHCCSMQPKFILTPDTVVTIKYHDPHAGFSKSRSRVYKTVGRPARTDDGGLLLQLPNEDEHVLIAPGWEAVETVDIEVWKQRRADRPLPRYL